MKPKAPPPQLVISPVFWPSARILKKHWATSSISSAIASALPSTIRPELVLCRVDTISIRSGERTSFLLDNIVVNMKNDTWIVVFSSDLYCAASGSGGAARCMDRAAQQINNTGTAGVIARPPLLFLAALLLGFVLDHLLSLPVPIPRTDLHRITAGFMIFIGIAVFVAGIRNFSSAATPVQGTEPTRTLVTTGIHGWSRTPISIGMFLVYAGIGIAVRSPWILILALPLAITMRYGVVAREEAYLERRFGDAYRDYKARVRRWL